MRKILFVFLIAFILLGIYSLAAQGPGDTLPAAGSSTTGTTAPATTSLKDFTQTVGNVPTSIGDKIVSGAKPEDVSVKNADVKKTGKETDVTIKETFREGSIVRLEGNKIAGKNDIENTKKPEIGYNELSINEKGQVTKADLTIGDKKDASNKPAGQDLDVKKIKFNAPEGSKVTVSDSGTDKEKKTIKVDLKAGTQISKVPLKREKKEGDDEEQGKVQYRSLDGFVKLPDDVAKSFNANSIEFKGILSHDGTNWMIDSGQSATWKIDGKEALFSPNIHDKVAKADENLRVFFGEFDRTKDSGGAYVDFAKDGVKWGSTGASEGHPLSILKDNPWGVNVGDKGLVSGVPFEKSELYIKKDGSGIGKPSLALLGSGLIGDDYVTYKFEDLGNGKVDIKFKEGVLMQGLSVAGKPTNVAVDILPFKADGTTYSTNGNNKILIGTGGESNFKVVPMAGSEKDVGRVMLGQKPVESTPGVEAPPIIPEGRHTVVGVEQTQQIIKQLSGSRIGPVLQSMMQDTNEDTKKFLSSLENKNYKGFAVIFTNPSSCPPCARMENSGVISGFAKNNLDIKVIKVNTGANPILTSEYNVGGIPAISVFDNNGNLRGEFVGEKTSAQNLNSAVRNELTKPPQGR